MLCFPTRGSIQGSTVEAPDAPLLRRQERAKLLRYGFRNKNGKAIVAYWIAAHSVAGAEFPPLTVDLKLENSGIRAPVLIDITTGEITALAWKQGTKRRYAQRDTGSRQHPGDRGCELFRLAGAAGST